MCCTHASLAQFEAQRLNEFAGGCEEFFHGMRYLSRGSVFGNSVGLRFLQHVVLLVSLPHALSVVQGVKIVQTLGFPHPMFGRKRK